MYATCGMWARTSAAGPGSCIQPMPYTSPQSCMQYAWLVQLHVTCAACIRPRACCARHTGLGLSTCYLQHIGWTSSCMQHRGSRAWGCMWCPVWALCGACNVHSIWSSHALYAAHKTEDGMWDLSSDSWVRSQGSTDWIQPASCIFDNLGLKLQRILW